MFCMAEVSLGIMKFEYRIIRNKWKSDSSGPYLELNHV